MTTASGLTRESKAALLEEALESMRRYKALIPVAKRNSATGAKVDLLIERLERLADRFANR